MNKIDTTLNLVMQEIKKEVLPKIKLKEPIIYYGSKKGLGKFLGFNYSNNKTNKPIIRLNCLQCLRSLKKDLSLYTILLTTILHELAHALQELKGKPFNEAEAEQFAYSYWSYGIIENV